MARSLILSVALMLAVVVAISEAQILVPVESAVDDQPADVVETVDQVDDDSTLTADEPRPKRQFLAGLALGSLIGGHRYGYGYGGYGGYGHHHHHRPHYHGYGGYGYGSRYPYYG